jgi:hypothetical protein
LTAQALTVGFRSRLMSAASFVSPEAFAAAAAASREAMN